MDSLSERDQITALVLECQVLRNRLVRGERRMRWAGGFLLVALFLPVLAGAYSTNDEIVLRDSITNNVRILLKANPNGPAFIQINASNGSRRMHLGESNNGSPNLTIYNPNGSVATAIGP